MKGVRYQQRLGEFKYLDEKAYMNDVVITVALCNAVGKFNDSIAKVRAVDLGAEIIKALLARSGVQAD